MSLQSPACHGADKCVSIRPDHQTTTDPNWTWLISCRPWSGGGAGPVPGRGGGGIVPGLPVNVLSLIIDHTQRRHIWILPASTPPKHKWDRPNFVRWRIKHPASPADCLYLVRSCGSWHAAGVSPPVGIIWSGTDTSH